MVMRVEVLGSQFTVHDSGFKVVSNLPYSISTPILERLVEGDLKPRRIVVTLQREVAQRLAAQPRTKDYGALTLFTQLHYHCTVAHIVSSGCFYPPPRVESAIVVLDRRDPRVKLKPGAPFHEIVRTGFGQRRKMLKKLIAKFGDVDGRFCCQVTFSRGSSRGIKPRTMDHACQCAGSTGCAVNSHNFADGAGTGAGMTAAGDCGASLSLFLAALPSFVLGQRFATCSSSLRPNFSSSPVPSLK